MMLYMCDGTNGERGVHVRSATNPYGPWSVPQRIWAPKGEEGIGYCEFMYSRDDGGCEAGGTNPKEGSQRLPDGTFAWGGEYAPLLLPTEYFKPVGGGEFTFYYGMSTWNPYQVVLMKSTGALPPAP